MSDSDRPATVSDACRIVADRTGDQQAAHILRDAAGELDRLTAELAKHQPEERVGACGCQKDGCVWGDMVADAEGNYPIPAAEWTRKHSEWIAPFRPVWHWMDPACQDNNDANEFCPGCGWELDHDTGIARRNADAGRVARVREALDKAEHWSNAQHLLLAGAIRKEINAIRAALDGGGDGG